MSPQTFDNQSIALHQLETALRLDFEDSDYWSAITLAGAAEELLGQLLAQSGREHSLAALQKSAVQIHRGLFGEDTTEENIADVANLA